MPELRSPMSLLRNLASNRARLLVVCGLFGLALAALLLSLPTWRQPPPRILLAPIEGPDLDIGQREAVRDLVLDHLLLQGRHAAGKIAAVPGLEEARAQPRSALVLRLRLLKQGDQLGMEVFQAHCIELVQHPERAWRRQELPPAAPTVTFRNLLQALGLPPLKQTDATLLPESPSLFWSLLQSMGREGTDTRYLVRLDAARRVTQEEPRCVSAWISLGQVVFNHILSIPRDGNRSLGEGDRGLGEVEDSLRRALELVPHHPRASSQMAQFQVDAGDQREALRNLREALKRYPNATSLYSVVAYAARTSGLLDLAERSLTRGGTLLGVTNPPLALTENTYLYSGKLPSFEATLREQPARPVNARVRFYRGYLALMRGQQGEAEEWFLRGSKSPEGLGEFTQLSEVYADIAGNRPAAAWDKLQAMDKQRRGLQVPDGEFTFKIAEALALLGRKGEAQDMLQRAFSQGFGCTRWYRESPMLQTLREGPRWINLEQHLQEREALFHATFSPKDFGL